MELKATSLGSLLVFLLLCTLPAFTRGRLKNLGSQLYDIDYRGPETHTNIPPPNRAGGRPKIHHQASLARQRSKLNKGRRSGKNVGG